MICRLFSFLFDEPAALLLSRADGNFRLAHSGSTDGPKMIMNPESYIGEDRNVQRLHVLLSLLSLSQAVSVEWELVTCSRRPFRQ